MRSAPVPLIVTLWGWGLASCLGVCSEKDDRERFQEKMRQGQRAREHFEFQLAKQEFKKAHELAQKLGANTPEMAKACNWLGEVERQLGNYREAELLFGRSLEIFQSYLGKDANVPLHVARNHQNLGVTFKTQGKYARAEQEYRAALQILAAKYHGRPDHAICLHNLAQLYQAMDRLMEAERPFAESLALLEGIQPKKNEHTALIAAFHSNLGWYWQARKETSKARKHYVRAVELLDGGPAGERNPVLASAVTNLGVTEHGQGKLLEAEKAYERGLRIRKAAFGDSHPDVAMSLANVAGVEAALGRWNDASSHADRARRVMNEHVSQALVALSDHEKLEFLRTAYQPDWYSALSMAWARRNDPGLVERSAEWVCNGKALANEVFAGSLLQARDSGRPDLKKWIGDLRDVQQELAVLRATGAGGEPELFRKKLSELDEREKVLTRKIYEAGGHRLPGKNWVALQSIRTALPENGVLIDIVRLKIWNFKYQGVERDWQPAHYLAWVIPARGGGDVRLVDLGDAQTIEKAVRAFVEVLESAQGDGLNRNRANDRKMRKALEDLAVLLIRPLAKHTGRAGHWVLSPDNLLWMIPWGALPIEGQKVLLEKVSVRYVVAGRHVVPAAKRPPQGRAPQSSALVLADPDFEQGPKAIKIRPGAELEPTNRGRKLRFMPVDPLPFTRKEAKGIVPDLTRLLNGREPEVLVQGKASITELRKFKQPPVLVLCTHGFYQTASNTGVFALSRCGLALAGFNHYVNGDFKVAAGSDDGLLLGEDVVRYLDLEGTRLVVLSACRTAQGDLADGEAISGLRQAFQLAGARSVVATLWSVDDEQAALLNQDFFRYLAEGHSEAESLRRAQVNRIKSLKSSLGYAHPYYWASHTLTGP